MRVFTHKVAFQQPPILAPEKTGICSELKGAQLSDAQRLEICLSAMPEEACRKCFGARE